MGRGSSLQALFLIFFQPTIRNSTQTILLSHKELTYRKQYVQRSVEGEDADLRIYLREHAHPRTSRHRRSSSRALDANIRPVCPV